MDGKALSTAEVCNSATRKLSDVLSDILKSTEKVTVNILLFPKNDPVAVDALAAEVYRFFDGKKYANVTVCKPSKRIKLGILNLPWHTLLDSMRVDGQYPDLTLFVHHNNIQYAVKDESIESGLYLNIM